MMITCLTDCSFNSSQRYCEVDGVYKNGQGASAAQVRAKKSYQRKRAIGNTLISIVAVFILCWSPSNIFMVIMDTNPYLVPHKKVSYCVYAVKVTSNSKKSDIAMSSLCVCSSH